MVREKEVGHPPDSAGIRVVTHPLSTAFSTEIGEDEKSLKRAA